MLVLLLIIPILCFLALEAFFSGSETALISVNKMRLKALTDRGDRRAKLASTLLGRPDRLLGTTLRTRSNQVEREPQLANPGGTFAHLVDACRAERPFWIVLLAQGKTMLHEIKLHFMLSFHCSNTLRHLKLNRLLTLVQPQFCKAGE